MAAVHHEARWSEVRLSVYRNADGRGTWALVFRAQAGGRAIRRLLAHGTIPLELGSPESTMPLAALRKALSDADGSLF